jgi:hypothetical protein
MEASNINIFSTASLTKFLIPGLSSDPVHMHGLNTNITEGKVSRHIMASGPTWDDRGT